MPADHPQPPGAGRRSPRSVASPHCPRFPGGPRTASQRRSTPAPTPATPAGRQDAGRTRQAGRHRYPRPGPFADRDASRRSTCSVRPTWRSRPRPTSPTSWPSIAPSFNTQRFPIADGTAFVRPANLRNLPPDQTLVLINGKRRHRSALVNLQVEPFGTVNQGSQAVDYSLIPSAAISARGSAARRFLGAVRLGRHRRRDQRHPQRLRRRRRVSTANTARPTRATATSGARRSTSACRWPTTASST